MSLNRAFVPTPLRSLIGGRYRTRVARSAADLDAVLRLRYEVFNLELDEGLRSSHLTGRDRDAFDAQCDHLLVEDQGSGEVVGTYRMQTAERAREGIGFYSAGEFDLSGLTTPVLDRSVEIGRACIAREHRSRSVLFLLWRALAGYVIEHRKRYLFGCSSLTSQDPAAGLCAFEEFRASGHLHSQLRVEPLPGLGCEAATPAPAGSVRIPILFRTYLRHGALVCGPPAIDRAFRTIDFLTILDIHTLPARLREIYLDRSAP
jgi:putative hemolysin